MQAVLGKCKSSRVKAFSAGSRASGGLTAQLVDGEDGGSLRHIEVRRWEFEGPLRSWPRTTTSLGKGACLNTNKLCTFDKVRLKAASILSPQTILNPSS